MKRLRQIMAWLTIVLIVGLIIGAVVCAVTGSRYFFGLLVLAMAVPIVLWVFMWFTRLIYGDSDVVSKEDMYASNQKNDSKEEG
ncbi:MAG: hypothetical protein K2J90_06515 [Lachnospiraceae bacterium]|nr:hypothetical protein [Lachnospiraceae bacterium]